MNNRKIVGCNNILNVFGAWTLFYVAILRFSTVIAQDIPIGTWRLHPDYSGAQSISTDGQSLLVPTTNFFLEYDIEYKNIKVVSKLDGLSQNNPTLVRYDAATRSRLYAYANGVLDIEQNGKITRLDAIRRNTTIIGSKRINDVCFGRGNAYLAADFGIVVVNLAKIEVRESNANLGNNGLQQLSASAIEMFDDTIWLATSQGLMFAPSARSLQNIANWRIFSPNASALGATHLCKVSNKMLGFFPGTGFFLKNSQTRWQPVLSGWQNIKLKNIGIGASDSFLLIEPNKIWIFSGSGTARLYTQTGIRVAKDALQMVAGGPVWIADSLSGLIQHTGASFEVQKPAGAISFGSAIGFHAYQDKIVALAGGYIDNSIIPSYNRSGFSIFENGKWQNFSNLLNTPNLPYTEDATAAQYNPANNTLYVGTFGAGLLARKPNDSYDIYNLSTPRVSFEPIFSGYNHVRIPSLDLAPDGSLWMLTSLTPAKPVHVLKPDGSWRGYSFGGRSVDLYCVQMIHDNFGQKWLRSSSNTESSSSPMLVFNDKGDYRYLGPQPSEGNLPDGLIYTMAKDNNGEIWVGTGKGVAVFDNVSQILDPNQPISARRPIIDGFNLLNEDVVTSICVDGGNRKWIGTSANGLWLFNETGSKELSHFTFKNSPLPEGSIKALGLNKTTGELFVSTQNGIFSYRTASSEAISDEAQCFKVFPNPVPASFKGQIGISNLPANSFVKIMDMSGKLVWQGQANGSTISWNGNDYQGKKTAAGVYLILAATAQGDFKSVCKMSFID